MRTPSAPRKIAMISTLLAVAALAALPAAAQSTPTSPYDRLFLSFAEDATVVPNQWWEGQLEYVDGDGVDTTLGRVVVAFQPVRRLEVGGRVGFGSTDTGPGLPDGRGATDLDVWGKYHLGTFGDDTELAAGGLVTVPTGDNTAGLGQDSFGAEGFLAVRQRLQRAIITGNLGFRFNDDGNVFGVDLQGKTSAFLGVGAIVPIADEVSFVGEARVESARFEGGETDFRVLGGVNWRLTNRGMLRGAIAVGLTDGAPNAQFLAGYAANF